MSIDSPSANVFTAEGAKSAEVIGGKYVDVACQPSRIICILELIVFGHECHISREYPQTLKYMKDWYT